MDQSVLSSLQTSVSINNIIAVSFNLILMVSLFSVQFFFQCSVIPKQGKTNNVHSQY